MINNLPKKRIPTYKMAAKTNWHRYGSKLRHCHTIYCYVLQLEMDVRLIMCN